MRSIQLLAVLALIIPGCVDALGPEDLCRDQMKTIRQERGTPDEVRSEESGGDYFETWTYFPGSGQEGATYLFRWGTSFGTSCYVEGTATFDIAPLGLDGAGSAIEDGSLVHVPVKPLQQG